MRPSSLSGTNWVKGASDRASSAELLGFDKFKLRPFWGVIEFDTAAALAPAGAPSTPTDGFKVVFNCSAVLFSAGAVSGKPNNSTLKLCTNLS